MDRATEALLTWVAAVLVALAAAITAFMGGDRELALLPPPPDFADTVPTLPPDTRMVQGRFPFLGFGAETFQQCAPEGGGDWDVRVIRVGADKAEAIERIPEEGDLVVLVYPVGGLHAQSNPAGAWRRLERKSCIFDAAHTAPETYFMPAEHVRGGLYDFAMRGMGYLPSGDTWSSNQYYVECPLNVHVDMASFAFAEDDHVRFTGIPGRGDAPDCYTGRSSLVRVVVGPSANGRGGRGGGPNPDECDGYTIGWWLGFENMRRNPAVSCTGRVNVTNVVVANATDAGRYGSDVRINVRGVLSMGGPITGCAWDRGLTWFDPTYADMQGEYFLGDVKIVSPVGCTWTEVTSPWDDVHSVFHRTVWGTPVPFSGAGVAMPHEDPMYRVPILGNGALLRGMIQQAGANWGLECDGTWKRRETDLDGWTFTRLEAGDFADAPWSGRNEYESVYGPIDTPAGTPCADIDHDGIPDLVAQRWGHNNPGKLADDGRPLIFHWLEGYES